jgi:sensor histidine kinase regulating citrate/malate metabolism
MFLTLLFVTLVLSALVSLLAARAFAQPLQRILQRLIADDIFQAWQRYMQFAIFVVGISSGVRIYDLERYISPMAGDKDAMILTLTTERWVLELYRTVIETLQGIAWMLLLFFVVSLIAYVIVRLAELKRLGRDDGSRD